MFALNTGKAFAQVEILVRAASRGVRRRARVGGSASSIIELTRRGGFR